MTTRTDRDGRVRQWGYDASDRLTTVVMPGGATRSTSYDDAGRIVSTTGPRGHTTHYQHGPNEQQVEDPLGFVTEHHFDSRDLLVERIDALGNRLVQVRDAEGRVVQARFDDGTTKTVVRSSTGKPIEVIDQLGNSTHYEYDRLDRLVRVTDPLGSTTHYAHNELGDLIGITDALGRTTRMEYDAAGRMVRRVLPLGQVETFEYDAEGKVVRHVDFDGDATTFEYDLNDQLVRKVFADDTEIRYRYSPGGLRTQAGGATATYDAAGRVASVTDSVGQQLSYAYDASGNVTSITSPYGVTTKLYDGLDRLEEVTDATGATGYAYDAVGNLARMEYPNGVVTELDYDDLYRLIEMRVSGPSGLLARYRYDLDATGRRTRVEETGPATEDRVVTYGYDAAGRLVAETVDGPGVALDQTREYQLDAVGNRLRMTVRNADGELTVDYDYDDNDRLVRKTTSFAAAAPLRTAPLAVAAADGVVAETLLFYDDNGALVRREQGGVADVFSWNPAGRLVAADLRIGRPSPTALAFEYDADGNRTAATVDGVTTRYLVDTNRDLPMVLAESEGGQVTTFSHGHDPIAQTRGGSTHWYLYDGSMSVRHLVDSAGVVTDSYSYDAFGVDLGSDGATPNPFRYRGEQLDESLGMYYLRARYYDQDDGVFLGRDPAAGSPSDPRTFHRYLYAGADPVNHLDPTGAFSVPELALVFTVGFLIGAGFTYYFTKDLALSFAVGIGLGLVVTGLAAGPVGVAIEEAGLEAWRVAEATKEAWRIFLHMRNLVIRSAGYAGDAARTFLASALLEEAQVWGVLHGCRILRILSTFALVGVTVNGQLTSAGVSKAIGEATTTAIISWC